MCIWLKILENRNNTIKNNDPTEIQISKSPREMEVSWGFLEYLYKPWVTGSSRGVFLKLSTAITTPTIPRINNKTPIIKSSDLIIKGVKIIRICTINTMVFDIPVKIHWFLVNSDRSRSFARTSFETKNKFKNCMKIRHNSNIHPLNKVNLSEGNNSNYITKIKF